MAPPVAGEGHHHHQWDPERNNPPSAASANPFSDRIQMKPIGGMKFMQKAQGQPPQHHHSSTELDMPPNTGSNEQQESRGSQRAILIRELQGQVAFLYEKVRQLSNELQTTRQSHQLSSDQSRAEITMLQNELKNQNARHEEIVASLRKRLVESEMARTQIQDRMVAFVEEDAKKEHAVLRRWNEMASKVNEDAKWVEEQMSFWKESMEEHERRMSAAKIRGEVNAELPSVGMKSDRADFGGVEREKESAAERRRNRRSMLGLDDYDSDED